MVNYIFKLEFNYKDTIFFSIQNEERDVALIVFEDCCRKGELLKDFPFLCPQYYSSEEEWDDDRNLITASVYALIEEEYPKEMQDDIEYLVESMIEYKPAVNHKVQFFNNPTVRKYYSERTENRMQFINYVLSLCENKETVSLNEDDFNHLTQYKAKRDN